MLAEGEVTVEGRLPWSSNATLLVSVAHGDDCLRAVYKPERGERPLWDFPPGLWRREIAAYAVSEALGWSIVPETVARTDGPFGEGSLQLFLEDADQQLHYFNLLDDPAHHDDLRRIAVFDLLINNADRKGGHCLRTADGRIYGIDHGLGFRTQPSLRTVIWDFGGEQLDEAWRVDLRRVADDVPALEELLTRGERDAFRIRARALAETERLPSVPEDDRPYPWPLV
ncbi:MAG TPA: SCO1664 family protein [Acidimicrobiales bacterium]|nr:SCO1664 family protein [Acidimicrobiales bacterium]